MAGGGGCAEVTSGHSAAVDLKGLCIFPTLVRVPSGGGEVTFTNYDEINHVVVGAGYAWGSDGIMHQGDSFTAQFTRDGVYPFQCYLHPGMSGAVLVGDANARGAATSGGVTVPVPSNVAVTPSPRDGPETRASDDVAADAVVVTRRGWARARRRCGDRGAAAQGQGFEGNGRPTAEA